MIYLGLGFKLNRSAFFGKMFPRKLKDNLFLNMLHGKNALSIYRCTCGNLRELFSKWLHVLQILICVLYKHSLLANLYGMFFMEYFQGNFLQSFVKLMAYNWFLLGTSFWVLLKNFPNQKIRNVYRSLQESGDVIYWTNACSTNIGPEPFRKGFFACSNEDHQNVSAVCSDSVLSAFPLGIPNSTLSTEDSQKFWVKTSLLGSKFGSFRRSTN